MQRIVLDTNVFVSSIIGSGYSSAILAAARRGEILLVTSAHMIEEFSDVILRPRITRKYPAAAKQADDLLDFLRTFALVVPGNPDKTQTSADRDDDYVLACALEGRAEYIVSGDPHLLDLKSYQGIPILTPREFVDKA